MPLTSNEGLYSRYRKALLSTERVRELSRPAPVRVVADTVACWIAIFAAWYLVAILGTWWSVAVAIPIIGNRYYALFILGHDGMHRRLFERPGPNDLFCDLFLLGPIGAITRINNRNHLGHHHHLASDEDPDRVRHACFNKATVPETVAFLSGLTTLLPIVHNVFMPNRAGDLEPSKGKARERPTVAYRARDLLILLPWQAGLVTGLTLGIGWWAFPVLWLLPLYLFTYLGDLTRSFLEHSHPESDAEADRHRLITYQSNVLERALVAPMCMNFHAVHHLWPSIPYFRLRQADSDVRALDDTLDLEWRGSYFRYLLTYLRALPLEGCGTPGDPTR